MLTKPQSLILGFNVLYLVLGGLYFLQNLNNEFVIYILVIAILVAGVFLSLPQTHFPVWMLFAFSIWGLMHVLGGAVVINDHVLFAHRIYPFIDHGGDFYILKYDQVVHGYLYGLVAIMSYHVLRNVFGVSGKTFGVALAAVLISVGVSALNEIMEFIISLTVQNGVGGYDNTMLDFVFNLSGAVLAVALYILMQKLKQKA